MAEVVTADHEAELAVDEFFTAFAQRRKEARPNLSLPDGSRPRGLTADGLVRTTGWLQFGSRPIDSALVAAAVGLLAAIMITIRVLPSFVGISGLVPLLPAICYLSWRALTKRLRPASGSRNLKTVSVLELRVGDWVRLHGSIGPVGEVAALAAEIGGRREVEFLGGVKREWSRYDRLHLVELLD
ncbi:MAG TPA: hypothetical protein VGD48_30725 [Kutzneria sp.]